MFNLSSLKSLYTFSNLFKKAGYAFLLKISAALVSFVLSVYVARNYSPEMTGIFFLSLTTINFLVGLSNFGLGNPVIRFIASREVNGVKGYGVYRIAITITLMVSVIVSSSLPLLFSLFKSHISISLTIKDIYAISAANFFGSFLFLHVYVLQGLGRVFVPLVSQNLAVPLLTIITLHFTTPITSEGIIGAYVFSILCTALFLVVTTQVATPVSYSDRASYKYVLKIALPCLVIVVLDRLNIFSMQVMLSFFSSEEDIARFAVVTRISSLLVFILTAVNFVVASKISQAHSSGNFDSLKRISVEASRILYLSGIPLVFMLMISAEFFLSLFGENYSNDAFLLRIVVLAQGVNIITGCVTFLLMMTGNETALRNSMLMSTAISITVGLLLIPKFGALGAIIAYSSHLILSNCFAWRIVKKKLNINTLIPV